MRAMDSVTPELFAAMRAAEDSSGELNDPVIFGNSRDGAWETLEQSAAWDEPSHALLRRSGR